MQSFKSLFLASTIFLSSPFIKAETTTILEADPQSLSPVKITTWNLEHMMSLEVFKEWAEFCGREDINWDDDIAKSKGKPKNLTYCNAHSGLNWPQKNKQESLSLRTLDSYKEKIRALRERAKLLNSDIYAFQEISDINAMKAIVPDTEYSFFFTPTEGVPMQVGYAVKKTLSKNSKHKLNLNLAVCSEEDRVDILKPSNCKPGVYRTRPGLELELNINGNLVKLLNVHLKSSCRSYPLDGLPDNAKDWNKRGCSLMRAQLPALEEWIDNASIKNEKIVILGDFNRDFVKEFGNKKKGIPKMEARLDGSSSSDEITPSSKIGAVFAEINDNSPQGSKLYLEWQKIHTKNRSCPNHKEGEVEKVRSCHTGIDHIIINQALYKSLNNPPSKIIATGSDYGDNAYCAEFARPSDHCPVTVNLDL